MAQPAYIARLVQFDGTVLTTFSADLIVESATYTLNEPDEADLSFPKNALTSGDLDVLVTGGSKAELQIIDTANDDRLMFWGPIISLSGGGSDGSVHVKCAGVDWYLMRRFLDGTVTEYLDNPDFEDSLTSWTDHTSGAYSFDTDRVFLGDQSLKLVGSGAGAFVDDKFVDQTVTSVAGGTLGLALVLSGWFYVGDVDYEPAIEGRGLYIELLNGATVVTTNYFPIDQATAKGKWQKTKEIIVSIPPSATYDVNVRCYAGSTGTIWWDDIKLTQFDSFGFVDLTHDENTAADVGDFLCHLVACVQDTGFGKSDVHIDTDPTTIGTKTMQTFFFSDHVQFDQAVEQFLNGSTTSGGQDYAIIYDAGAGTRTFTNYARRGTDRTGGDTPTKLVFSVPGATSFADRNCADYRFTEDGANCITDQTVLGDDSGPDREEAIVQDTSNVDGIVLQDVRQSPQGTEVRRLQGMAQRRLDIFSVPPLTIEMDVRPDVALDLLALPLVPGDTILATIEDGFFQFDGGGMRVNQMKLNFVTGVLTVTLSADGT